MLFFHTETQIVESVLITEHKKTKIIRNVSAAYLLCSDFFHLLTLGMVVYTLVKVD